MLKLTQIENQDVIGPVFINPKNIAAIMVRHYHSYRAPYGSLVYLSHDNTVIHVQEDPEQIQTMIDDLGKEKEDA